MTLRHGKIVMVTTVVRTGHYGVKMEQRNLAKNGLWGQDTNILKITVACVEKRIVTQKHKVRQYAYPEESYCKII